MSDSSVPFGIANRNFTRRVAGSLPSPSPEFVVAGVSCLCNSSPSGSQAIGSGC